MKKIVKILAPILMLNSLVLTGCKKQDNRVLLSFGDMHAEESKAVELSELDIAIAAKDNFLLVVSATTCGCWDSFKPCLNSYIKKNKVLCYRVTYNQLSNKDVAAAYGLTKLSSSSTTFAIFENGKLKTAISTSEESSIMYNKDKFEKYMNETVRLPGCYFITKDDYFSIKSSKKNAVIYFERSECHDCTAANPGILRNYIKDHSDMNKIYVLDLQPYYAKSGEPGYDNYMEIKKSLGMDEVSNTKYGYGSGAVPFFSLLKAGKYASGAIIYNDTVTKVDGKYKITSSYYTKERVKALQFQTFQLQGKEIPKKEVDDNGAWVSWKHEAADKIYGDVLTNFLDYALPQVTFSF